MVVLSYCSAYRHRVVAIWGHTHFARGWNTSDVAPLIVRAGIGHVQISNTVRTGLCEPAAQGAMRCVFSGFHTFIEAMTAALAHRGPDDDGIYLPTSPSPLGFRRLAILDLSNSGHQPMKSPDGRFVIVVPPPCLRPLIRQALRWRCH